MALPSFGTETSFDTLASSTQTIAQFGEDRAWDAIASVLTEFNRQKTEMSSALVKTTTSRLMRYGVTARMKMQRTDEVGTPLAQKVRANAIIGLPLSMNTIAVQYNRLFLKTGKADQLAAQVTAAMTASMTAYIGSMKAAILGATNYMFEDDLVDHVGAQFALPVKALVNADGLPIPPGPHNEAFNPLTHTHYLASSTLTNTAATALVNTVKEHYNTGSGEIWINQTEASAWEALSDFKTMVNGTFIKTTVTEYAVGDLNEMDINNRQIGWYLGFAVFVKPFWPANYPFAYMSSDGQQVIAKRVRGDDPNGGNPIEGAGDLQLAFEDESHPLKATGWEEEYGMGVWNRTAGAVLYIGGSAYVIPDLTTFF